MVDGHIVHGKVGVRGCIPVKLQEILTKDVLTIFVKSYSRIVKDALKVRVAHRLCLLKLATLSLLRWFLRSDILGI